MSQLHASSACVAIIGAGPAGLMAADIISQTGIQTHVFDRMPSVARKFLLAGIGGLNITHSENFELFCNRYTPPHIFDDYLQQFGPKQVTNWCAALGIETFKGTSGKIFPKHMKAAPLLRAWLKRLQQQNVIFHLRHDWQGWQNNKLCFINNKNELFTFSSDATLLALGGASYPRLGTDGQWTQYLKLRSIDCTPWQASNCGFETKPWTTIFASKFVGLPIKNIAGYLEHQQKDFHKGELIITKHGLEGGLIYALSNKLNQQISRHTTATLYLDLMPQYSLEKIKQQLKKPQGSQSLKNYLRKQLNLQGTKLGLIRELAPNSLQQLELLPNTLKKLPLILLKPRPITEAISSAGGICFSELDKGLMLKKLPSIFCAGEMLDWDAPTGGYLLTGCFSTGFIAANAIIDYLKI